jgi:hypothetical protein
LVSSPEPQCPHLLLVQESATVSRKHSVKCNRTVATLASARPSSAVQDPAAKRISVTY